MPEKWTGDVLGKMHVYGITNNELADEMNVTRAYISMLLNSKRKPDGIQERIESAVSAIVARKSDDLLSENNEEVKSQ